MNFIYYWNKEFIIAVVNYLLIVFALRKANNAAAYAL